MLRLQDVWGKTTEYVVPTDNIRKKVVQHIYKKSEHMTMFSVKMEP